MNRIFGMVMAAGLVLGHATVADAQVSISIGELDYGTGNQIGQPYGYGYGAGDGGTTYYGSGYSSYVAPGTTSFSSGYYAPAPFVYGAPVYGVAAPVIVPLRSSGYRGYGYRRGIGLPLLGGRRW